jgi:transcriptional regulator with XRE-family HTH domain
MPPPRAAQDVQPDAAPLLPRLLRSYRRAANLTQFRLAELAGVSYARLVAAEQSRVELRPPEIQKLIGALPALAEALSLLKAVAATEREGDDGA